MKRSTIWTLFALWIAVMTLSALALTQPVEGDGFTRGLNRIVSFLSWQLAGMLLAVGLWVGARPLPSEDRLRWLARLPAWWSGVVIVLVAAWIFIGLYGSG